MKRRGDIFDSDQVMPPSKRKYDSYYYTSGQGAKRPRYGNPRARALASATIQRYFRGYKSRKSFTRRVTRAVRSTEAQQYCVKNLLNQTSVTQAPTVYHISNIHYDNTGAGANSPKWYRNSNRCFIQNLHLNIRVTGGRDDFNTVCVALVRHKRSEPITDAMLQQTQITPPAVIPQLQNTDAPFLPINTNAATPATPPAIDLNFGYTARNANVDSLASFFNPKVIDLIWHKTVKVQPLFNPAVAPQVAFPTGWPYIRDFEFNKKMNETWVFPSAPPNSSGNGVFPTVHNKCYSLIVWSDSLSSSASHPSMDVNMRLSFKDQD